ncbi:hypothetical protein EV424DRAFT_1399002 [Suillus variegatus]|nr:hypothetical protein EV424DRAFT_1399002 [Suillus variegatus]
MPNTSLVMVTAELTLIESLFACDHGFGTTIMVTVIACQKITDPPLVTSPRRSLQPHSHDPITAQPLVIVIAPQLSSRLPAVSCQSSVPRHLSS